MTIKKTFFLIQYFISENISLNECLCQQTNIYLIIKSTEGPFYGGNIYFTKLNSRVIWRHVHIHIDLSQLFLPISVLVVALVNRFSGVFYLQ